MDSASRDAFSEILRSQDRALVVVTTATPAERAGCLVGFHTQSSMDPGRFCVWLSKANHTYRVALRATHLAVHFLTSADLDVAAHFGTLTGDSSDKFAEFPTAAGAGGAPVLQDWPRWLVARRIALLDEGGDHVCVITEPLTVHGAGPFEPLRLSQAEHLTPGHENDERHDPPTERAAATGR
jgi:flavin reductase (DIM6/NTAB) family NADH-FMN oxidoreductase RutF